MVILSLALSFVDSYSRLLAPLRSAISVTITPIYLVANTPYLLADVVVGFFEPRDILQQKHDELKERNLKLQQMIMHYQTLEEENQRFRALFRITNRMPLETKLVQVIGVAPGNMSIIMIDKGNRDGLAQGQAVVGGSGILGLLTEVNPFSSKVMLISDQDSAVPVRVRRTGFRSILGGTGNMDIMLLENVPTSQEILVGDILESTGLGGVYPAGYAIGEVTSFVLEETSAYAEVIVRPLADLSGIQDALVILE